jgi:hypothetical protein
MLHPKLLGRKNKKINSKQEDHDNYDDHENEKE